MISQETSYRDILKREFASRSQRNARYSLRAFARDLEFLPSRLSDILNGKQGLSRKSASALAEKLGFSRSENEFFCALVDKEHARSHSKREIAGNEIQKIRARHEYTELSEEAFAIIADWYHFAIMELVTVDGFINDKHWIARRLGISPVEAELGLQRLIRVGLLEKKGRRLHVAVEYPASMSEVPSQAIRSHHRQVLEKAGAALHLQSVDTRDFSSITMAIDSGDLPAIKEEIRKFRRGLEKCFKGGKKKKNSVYCLGVQFFGLEAPRKGSGEVA